MLPLRRFCLSEAHVSAPIPTLTNRQFVVASSSLSADEERVQRELFWHREEMFKRVKARWKEVRRVHSHHDNANLTYL